MNDGIYLPLDKERFAAFQKGVTKLIEQCQKAGAKQIFLVTPPIYDFAPKKEEFNYDAELTEYTKWETELKVTGVTMIDLHTAMRMARDARTAPFSGDKVHFGDDGHLLVANTILTALGAKAPNAVGGNTCESSTARTTPRTKTLVACAAVASAKNVRWRWVSSRWASKVWNGSCGRSRCAVFMSAFSVSLPWRASRWTRDSDLNPREPGAKRTVDTIVLYSQRSPERDLRVH
jgi:hypothetical protein